MQKFRKKPIIIEAEQLKDKNQKIEGVCNSCWELTNVPHIHTLEGIMHISIGDWVIRGIKGKYYSCKPDIFEMLYEKVKEDILPKCYYCGHEGYFEYHSHGRDSYCNKCGAKQ